MSKIRKYRAVIVPNVLKQKSFKGMPRHGHPERFEIDEADVAQMLPKMANLPLHYNHDMSEAPVGKVIASYRNPAKNNAWEVQYEIDGATPKGADMIDWIDKGKMKGVSLQHVFGKNEPLEVSICWRGARPGSETYESIAASKKIDRLVHFDSNSGCYTREPDPDAPIHIAASSDDDSALDDLFIFEVLAMSDERVAASATEPSAVPDTPVPQTQGLSLDAVPQQASPAAAAAAAQAPSGEAEDLFKRYNDAKNVLKYNNGILKGTDKQGILESMGALELEKAKEKARADALEAKLKAFEEKEAAARKELEDKVRKEQDEINAQTKQKIGDFVQAFDEAPEAIESANKIMASMTKDQLDLIARIGDRVQASYNGPTPMDMQIETAMDKFRQQQLRESQMPPQRPSQPIQQQQQQPIHIAASRGSAAAAPAALPFEFGRPHDRPYRSVTIAASKQKVANNYHVRGHYQPAQEYEENEREGDNASWKNGAGNNFCSSRITQDPGVRKAMHEIWESVPAGDGMSSGYDIGRVNIGGLFQDKEALHAAQMHARANKPAMPKGGYDDSRAHLTGLEF